MICFKHSTKSIQCIQLREDKSDFFASPCLVLLCKLLRSSAEIGESSALCFLLHSAAVTILFSLAGEMFHSSTCSRCSGVQHAQVLLRPLPVPCSAITAVQGLGFEVFPGCTFGESSEQGLHQKHFCFVQRVCYNQELNWTVPTPGRSEADRSF